MTESNLHDLASLMMASDGGISLITGLNDADNEYIVQIFMTVFHTMVTQYRHMVSGTDELFDSLNMAFVSTGYILHATPIARTDLDDYIYYSRLTPDGNLSRSNYHPFNLMTFMEPQQIPDSFKMMFSDQDYLPNVINVWDDGDPDSLFLLSFQKVNVHYGRHARDGRRPDQRV